MNAKDDVAANLQPVEGRKFPESLLIIAGEVLLGIFVLGPLGVILVLAWWYEWPLGTQRIALPGAMIGAVLAVLGLLSPLLLAKIFRRETIIVGKDCFQVVLGADKVTRQIPYRNIAQIRLIRSHERTDSASNFIGIVLANIEDLSTLCAQAETNMKAHGWHYRLQTGHRAVPLEQLYELIVKRMPPDFLGQ
jgi:hypothetical protein